MSSFNKVPKISMKQAAAFMKASKEALGDIKNKGINGTIRISKDAFFRYERNYYRWEDYKGANRRTNMLWKTACTTGGTFITVQSYLELEAAKKRLDDQKLQMEKHEKDVDKELQLFDEIQNEKMKELEIKMEEKVDEIQNEKMKQMEMKMEEKVKVLGEELERLKTERLKMIEEPKRAYLVHPQNAFGKCIANTRGSMLLEEERKRQLGLGPSVPARVPAHGARGGLQLALE